MPAPVRHADSEALPPLALTMGDPAGIGPDIAIEAWRRRQDEDLPPFVVIGDAALFAERAKGLEIELPVARLADPAEANGRFGKAFCVLHRALAVPVAPGRPCAAAAGAVTAAIELAVELYEAGDVGALITNPINKKLLYEAGFEHPGHTEFLGALALRSDPSAKPLMMLVCDELKVVPTSIHVPLKAVPALLTVERVCDVIVRTAEGLTSSFGIDEPRIAVAGLNPHAGEGGALGDEEARVISPAIARAEHQGVRVSGPHPGDTLFSPQMRRRYDAAVAMYHDQALIPIKTLAFERAVNVTLGLPFVRTSPDHGTAYDLAGSGKADAASLIAAIRLAGQIARHRLAQPA